MGNKIVEGFELRPFLSLDRSREVHDPDYRYYQVQYSYLAKSASDFNEIFHREYSKSKLDINNKEARIYFYQELIENLEYKIDCYKEIQNSKKRDYRLLYTAKSFIKWLEDELLRVESSNETPSYSKEGEQTSQNENLIHESLSVKKIEGHNTVTIKELTIYIKFNYRPIFETTIGSLNETKENLYKVNDKKFAAIALILYNTGWVTKEMTFRSWLIALCKAFNRTKVPAYRPSHVSGTASKLKFQIPLLDELPQK